MANSDSSSTDKPTVPATVDPSATDRERPWERRDDGPVIRAEQKDLNICRVCGQVVPVGATHCQCGRFAPKNHGFKNTAMSDTIGILRQKLLDDYRPATTFLRETCEQLARSLVESRTLPAGSQEWQRVWNTAQDLTKILDASRTQNIAASDAPLAGLTIAQLLESWAEAGRKLFALADAEQEGQARFAQVFADYQASVTPVASTTPATPAGEAPTSEPAPCPYCKRTCVGPNHFAYDVLHYHDPEVQRRRDAEATAVMKKQLGRGLPGWFE